MAGDDGDPEGIALLNQVDAVLNQFMHWPNEHASAVVATWIAASQLRTYRGEFLPAHTGRLYFGSTEAGCGKSLALELVGHMSYQGVHVSDVTPPALAAYLSQGRTLCFDEVDLYFGRGTGKGTARTILSDGYRRGTKTANVRSDEIVEFNICGPVAMAGKNLRKMQSAEAYATLRTRSHIIALSQKPAGVKLDRYRFDVHQARMRKISSDLTRWGMSNGPGVVSIDVEDVIPDDIDNRDRDIWTVLFQVAEYVGGDWPDRILRAANALVLGKWGDDETATVSPAQDMLDSVRAVFADDEPFLPTWEIVTRLMDLPTSHWWQDEWRVTSFKSRSMVLASQLRVFGIEGERATYDGEQERGYSALAIGRVSLANQTT